ncbi:hypothetical protein HON01_08760, partial [Candidatus Woesearchaeota archaeon]|nr:hypothetical protein [Candidatus Woesearchaeota archaeon]
MTSKLEQKIEIEKGDHKFIHFITNENIEGIISKNLPWHKDIYQSLQDPINERSITGGGRIDLNEENKQIKIYSSSGSYGSTNQVHIKKILQKKYPEFTITTDDELFAKQKQEAEKKKRIILRSIATNTQILNLLNTLPVDKKINLYHKTGINNLSKAEVKEYVSNKIGEKNHFHIGERCSNLDKLITLIENFNLRRDNDLKKEFLSKKGMAHIQLTGFNQGRGCTTFIPTFKTLIKYISELERVFTVTKEEAKPLAERIIAGNNKTIEEGRFGYDLKLLEDNQATIKAFDFGDELIIDIIKRKIDTRFRKTNWEKDEEAFAMLNSTIKELPENMQNEYVNKLALEYVQQSKKNKDSACHYNPLIHRITTFAILTKFGKTLDDEHLKTIEEFLKETTLDHIQGNERSTYYSDKFNKENILEIKKIIDYDKSLGKEIIENFHKQIKEWVQNSFHHGDLRFSPNLFLENKIITQKQLGELVKKTYIGLVTSEEKSHPSHLLEKFNIEKPEKIKIYEETLSELVAAKEFSTHNAFAFLNIANELLSLESNCSQIITNNYKKVCDILKEEIQKEDYYHTFSNLYTLATALKDKETQGDIIKAKIRKTASYIHGNYVYTVSQFFEKNKIDPSKFKSDLEAGLNTSYTDETIDEEKERSRYALHLELGLEKKQRKKQIEFLLQHEFDGEINNLTEDRAYHLGSIHNFIEEYKISPKIYLPKVDRLIRAA